MYLINYKLKNKHCMSWVDCIKGIRLYFPQNKYWIVCDNLAVCKEWCITPKRRKATLKHLRKEWL